MKRAYRDGDYAAVIELLNSRPLEVWFALAPAELGHVLADVPEQLLHRSAVAAMFVRTMADTPLVTQASSDPALLSTLEHNRAVRNWFVFAQASRARLQGDVLEAYELMKGLPDTLEPLTPLLEPSRGILPFFATQTAMTAMLAGDFPGALAMFERTIITSPAPELRFFTREAHLRIAVIHAHFGDPSIARLHLDRARAVPRTESWVEENLDVEERVVELLLMPADELAGAVDELLTMPLDRIGEMWPYYVFAVQRLTFVVGRRADGRERIEALRSIGLAGDKKPGFSGSAIDLTLALDSIVSGQVRRVRSELRDLDPSLWLTDLLVGLHAIRTAAPARAVRAARAAAPKTRTLRQAENRRLLLLAAAQLQLGDENAALDALRAISQPLAEAEVTLLRTLSPRLAELAGRELHSLPISSGPASFAQTVSSFEGGQLTEREQDILAGLAKGLTRDQVAESLYLSVNTVKTHQRNLYRKLGVSSLHAAIEVGRARGFL